MKFRSKIVEIVEIEAEAFRGPDYPLPFSKRGDPCCLGPEGWYIETLEGPFKLTKDDWVVRGLKGEFHPVKPDIFVMKYEPVE